MPHCLENYCGRRCFQPMNNQRFGASLPMSSWPAERLAYDKRANLFRIVRCDIIHNGEDIEEITYIVAINEFGSC